MTSSEPRTQVDGVPVPVPVPVPEPEVFVPLIVIVEREKEKSGSEAGGRDDGVAVPVTEAEAAAEAAGGKRRRNIPTRLARRRGREMLWLSNMASAPPGIDGPKRARPLSEVNSGSPVGSAKVAPEPLLGAGAAWPAKTLSHGVRSVIGRRRAMEDAVAVAAPLLVAAAGEEEKKSGEGEVEDGKVEGGGGWAPEFFAVYDGHGGTCVAETCRERLHLALAEEVARLGLGKAGSGGGDEDGARWREAMRGAFARVDGEVAVVQIAKSDAGHTEGSTAVVVVVEPRRIVVANCGDSRAVLCRGGVAVPLSTDHKPQRPDEMERIESVGGHIFYWQGARVLGVLATSRSIGDYFLKPSISAEPEVTVTDRTDTDEFIIIGSDGLWDVMSNEFACNVARCCLSGRAATKCPTTVHGSSASDAAALLADIAIARGSADNVSVVVVELRRLLWRRKAARQNGRT